MVRPVQRERAGVVCPGAGMLALGETLTLPISECSPKL